MDIGIEIRAKFLLIQIIVLKLLNYKVILIS